MAFVKHSNFLCPAVLNLIIYLNSRLFKFEPWWVYFILLLADEGHLIQILKTFILKVGNFQKMFN